MIAIPKAITDMLNDREVEVQCDLCKAWVPQSAVRVRWLNGVETAIGPECWDDKYDDTEVEFHEN